MPYIITTGKRFDYRDANVGGIQIESRRAVATLDDARSQLRITFGGYGLPFRDDDLGEAGETFDPLPDGTTIEVERVDWPMFALDVGYDYDYVAEGGVTESEIIDAYNAAAEVTV